MRGKHPRISLQSYHNSSPSLAVRVKCYFYVLMIIIIIFLRNLRFRLVPIQFVP